MDMISFAFGAGAVLAVIVVVVIIVAVVKVFKVSRELDIERRNREELDIGIQASIDEVRRDLDQRVNECFADMNQKVNNCHVDIPKKCNSYTDSRIDKLDK